MGRVNILIGANGSGKSNLFEALALYYGAPTRDLAGLTRQSGSPMDYIFRGHLTGQRAAAELDLEIQIEKQPSPIVQHLKLHASGAYFDILDERVEFSRSARGNTERYFFYRFLSGKPRVN